MRINLTGISERRCQRSISRREYFSNWHDWFAWYPVEVSEGDFRWLEKVLRKYPHASVSGNGFCRGLIVKYAARIAQ